jgi:hypothetical protein
MLLASHEDLSGRARAVIIVPETGRKEQAVPTENIAQQQVLDELQALEPNRWFEVLDFISFLKERAGRERAAAGQQELTARALLQSDIVGLWAERDDIGDSREYARRLRQEAECRRKSPSDPG